MATTLGTISTAIAGFSVADADGKHKGGISQVGPGAGGWGPGAGCGAGCAAALQGGGAQPPLPVVRSTTFPCLT